MDWWLLTFFLGAIFSLFLPIVPVLFQLFLFLLLAMVFFYHKRLRTSSGLLFGGLWVLVNAYSYQHQVPAELAQIIQVKQAVIIEGQVLTLTKFINEVESIEGHKPNLKRQQNFKFNFKVTKVNDQLLRQTISVRLNWKKSLVNISQGHLLRIKVKLKPAHGLANLGSFNYQAWLKSKNIVATGYVINDRKDSQNNKLISNDTSLRQRLFNQYQELFLQNKYNEHDLKPLIFALAFGERSQLTSEHWRVLQATGTGHLIAISGLHIGLVASGGFYFIMVFVRLLPLNLFFLGSLSLRSLARKQLLPKRLQLTLLPLSSIKLKPLTALSSILLNSNSRYIAIFFSVSIAIFYGFLAGFSLPTQRALVMLIIYWLTRLMAVKLSIKRWFLLTLFILVLMNPFSLFTASFWLSVYAVSFIFLTLWRFSFYLKQGNAIIRFFKGLLIIQISLTLMLLPISALFFQQLSVVAFFANIVAVPWMSFVSIPCALLSVVIMPINEFVAQLLIQVSMESITLLWSYLTFIADFPFAQQTISQGQHQFLIFVISFIFIIVLFTPSMSLLNTSLNRSFNISAKATLNRFIKGLLTIFFTIKAQLSKKGMNIIALSLFSASSFLFINLQLSKSKSINQHQQFNEHQDQHQRTSNKWQLHLFDVGQGLSILISREGQALLYDTGAAYPSGFNMVDSVVLPYLRYAGIKQLDKVFLSHSDNDHAGGLTQLIKGIDVKQLITNDRGLANKHRESSACYQGMNFHWQGVNVSALWPLMPEDKNIPMTNERVNKKVKAGTNEFTKEAINKVSKQGNDDSCVLLISDGKHKVLLTGDISKKVESKLLSLYPKLRADILLVPHHGSKTSSSIAFIKQISPQIALVSAGFLNRWAMPVKQVVARYQQQNIDLINTSNKGQVILTFTDDIDVENYHDDLRPFWFHK